MIRPSSYDKKYYLCVSGETPGKNTGKWLLYYKKSFIDEAWKLAKKLFKGNKLKGVSGTRKRNTFSFF